MLACLIPLLAGMPGMPSRAQDFSTDLSMNPHPPAHMQQAPEDAQAMTLDDLDALLPEHLRTPLPVRASRSVRAESEADDFAAITDPGPVPAEPPSAIEAFYREAAGNPRLTQYGYNFLAAGGDDIHAVAPAAGAVQDDYVLGAGDRLNVGFLGERKDRATYVVDRAGTLSIDMLPPVAAAGKTLGDLRSDISRLMDAQGYYGEVFVTLERVRQVGVLVAGHVGKPGRRALSPLQTALEALEQSGGILKTGSLRQIKLIRGGQATLIDLYAVMNAQNGEAPMPTLRDGDRIIVPPLGPTIAVSGDVRQPGIYELPAPGRVATSEAVALAGGLLSRGQNRITLMVPQGDGRRTAQMVSATSSMPLGDGAILAVTRTADRPAAAVTLQGETRSPGAYPLSQYPKLSRLLRSPEMFGDDVYPLMGIISRRRDADLARDLVAFSPQDVFRGRADMDLRDGDAITLLSRADVTATVAEKKKKAPAEDAASPAALPPLAATFVREHAVSLQGAVRLPGLWPVAGPVPVARVLDVAGGALSDADLTRAEISRNDAGLIAVSTGNVSRRDVVNLADAGADAVTVTAGDAVRIPDRFEAVTRQSVTVYGEVRNPGTYDLMRGDTLLSLIDRAGGITDQAYPMGTVFSRAAERRREKEKFASAARDLERAIALAAQGEDGKVDMAQIALAKELADELKTIEPAGRITVEADPAILRRDPAQDILLEAGDRIYVPKRPLTVRVTGEVLSPAALQFRADKDADDYLTEAGGTTLHADGSRVFVLYPNGSAQPLKTSWARTKPVMITPGSTIVVPRDPKPFDFIESAKDITQILSNLAITGIYTEDLVDRN